ncbi:hypothetical protein M407DRAFT_13371 [Tulasnella calospora MUT 4182]|uniref:CBS domain-containing protein n=1 Tax=Tulasnella calospora MUT 4182 TaxID=1051891 RepID=A0A0C3QYU7_9AGAM|nr:hypothetical protein M407DRAFT_13371 [Tulasnella calospora MUT 4182]
MSRIPIPTSSPYHHRSASPSGDRAPSPLPFPQRNQPPMSTLSASQSSQLPNTRSKTNKRDEAIRKKIESELSRKRTASTAIPFPGGKKNRKPVAQKGTVAALKPSPALTVPENITVADASQLCAAKRTDCVLVVDDEEGLSGIFTAKDLAYRVTAAGLDPRTTQVRQIMTPNPMVTRDTTSATEALTLMVQRGFRHLPVCNEEGNVVGLLDITKVFHEALDKIERGSSASQKLYSALEGVQHELGGGLSQNPQTAAMLAYVEALREKTALPDLSSVMDSRTQPATVGPKTTVRDAAKLMKENRTTAVCVVEGGANTTGGLASGPPKIAGIFTSKDVVLRVVAAGLDPGRCSVVRVMTPHPDVAPPSMTIHDALKKMYNGHYLNLPVVEDDGRLVAIIDVLKLTYATLEQMNGLESGNGIDSHEGGPMWGRFFESFAGGHDDNDSVVSGSQHVGTGTDFSTPAPFATPSKGGNRDYLHHAVSSPFSEVQPGDSASAIGEEPLPPPFGANLSNVGNAAAPIPVDDGTYVFKFRSPSGRTHRFQARQDDYGILRDIVSGKLESDPFFLEDQQKEEEGFPALIKPDPHDFTLAYTDADGDTVVITHDTDVTDAVKVARAGGSDRVVLLVQGGRGWEKTEKDAEVKAKESAVAAAKEVAQVDSVVLNDDPSPTPPPFQVHVKAPSVLPPNDLPLGGITENEVFGIPRDLVLPAALGFLGVVIAGVFVATRVANSSNRY